MPVNNKHGAPPVYRPIAIRPSIAGLNDSRIGLVSPSGYRSEMRNDNRSVMSLNYLHSKHSFRAQDYLTALNTKIRNVGLPVVLVPATENQTHSHKDYLIQSETLHTAAKESSVRPQRAPTLLLSAT